MQMDEIDITILNELKANGRATASEISKKIHLSIPAAAERIRKLEQSEIIQQYTIRINRQKTGQKLLAFILINIEKTDTIDQFREKIIQERCVLECHHVAGAYDYLLKVVLEDTQALEVFLSKKLKNIPGVASSNTFITLMTLKEDVSC